MEKIKNILFDLDGTIIEPQEGIINSILFALNKMDIREENHQELKSFIGPPLIDSFATRYHLNKGKAEKAVNYYRQYFSKKGMYQTTLYPDITKVLGRLKDENYNLFIATSKPTIYAKKILINFKIFNLFKEVTGSNLDNTRRDKTEIIGFILKTYGLDPNGTLMIGDRKFDIIGAKNNALMSIGAVYGHGSLEELQAEKVDFIANNCEELYTIISNKKEQNPVDGHES